MASINFYANVVGGVSTTSPSGINHAAGSGLGFYGASYGISVPVGQYQDTTWVTNANGTANDQYQLNNLKFMHTGSGQFNAGTTYPLWQVPNYYSPLNIRFTHDEAVRVQNCKLRIFDRNDVGNQASGVTTQVYEVRHPHPTAGSAGSGLVHRGVVNHDWVEFDPADSMLDHVFTSSPGVSGLNTVAGETLPSESGGFLNWSTNEGAAHESTRHDWYVALSASPDSIGSKTDYGLYFTCEYL